METRKSTDSSAVEFCSLALLKECSLLRREEYPDGHYQNFTCCSWAAVHSISATFVYILQHLAEKETTFSLQEK